MEFVLLIIGFLFGSIIPSLFFIFKIKNKKIENFKITKDLESKLKESSNELIFLKNSFIEKENYYKTSKELMENSFRSLSSKLLKENNEVFLTLAKEILAKQQVEGVGSLKDKENSFKNIVDPIKNILKEVKIRMESIEKDYQSTFTEVKEQFKYLKDDQKKLQNETSNLVKALRMPQVRGQWGELQLKRVVEMAGMINHVDFEEQVSTESENGKLRPDMIINLPGSKIIVIDAKTPLMAYLEGVDAKDENSRKESLKNHSRQVKQHIKKLGAKNYWDQFETSPEFVVLFLPNEAMYQSALEWDPSLIEAGINDNVLIATPTTLIALLKSVAYGWNQISLAENAKQISQLGKDLYDRMSIFVDNMNGIKKGLDNSVDFYNKAVSSFESRVLPSTRKFKELGITSEKEIEKLSYIEKISKDIKNK